MRAPAKIKKSSRKEGFDADDNPASHLSEEARQILDNFHLEDVVSHLIRRAHFYAEDLFAREFEDEVLTPRQKAALISLYQTPGQSQKGLANSLFMDHNTVAEMVSRLATAGLLKRVHATDDKRAYQLFLTKAGAQMLNRVMPRDMEIERSLVEKLPEEYRPLFLKCLRIITNHLTSNPKSPG